VGCDVLRLPFGVEGDQVQAPEWFAANLGGVVLDEAVVAPGPAKVKSWRSYSSRTPPMTARMASGPCRAPSSIDPSRGDVIGQLVHPRRVVVREPAAAIALSPVRRNAVGRLGGGHIGHPVRVAYGGRVSRPCSPGPGPWRYRGSRPGHPRARRWSEQDQPHAKHSLERRSL
jgi:hypothetical protein